MPPINPYFIFQLRSASCLAGRMCGAGNRTANAAITVRYSLKGEANCLQEQQGPQKTIRLLARGFHGILNSSLKTTGISD